MKVCKTYSGKVKCPDFISHMVQMKASLVKASSFVMSVFISHMVQMKVWNKGSFSLFLVVFISHMVQMKAVLLS